MRFTPAATPVTAVTAPVLFCTVFDDELGPKPSNPVIRDLDKALGGVLLQAASEEGFKGKSEQAMTFHTHGKVAPKRLVLLGLGDRKAFRTESLRLAAGRAAKMSRSLRTAEIAFVLPKDRKPAEALRAIVEGLELGAYKFDRYRTTNKDDKAIPALENVAIILPAGQKKTAEYDKAMALAQEISTATNWARDLVNEPAGELTPAKLAQEAKSLGSLPGIKVTIGGRKEIQALKMGMFLGVAQGSVLEPKLIHVTYTPSSAKGAKAAPVAFVGKAITFDSGGLSLKTAEGMVDMKTDMAGSAAVLGAMRVISFLKPPFPVHAFIGACENMPSGTAYRPGDILVSRLGKTVEITNTDAEGRLVLGDILTWASEHKPAALIDLATLTGACIIALGNYVTGTFSDDEKLVRQVLDAAENAGEELWRLPISHMQKDALRSDVADMKNSGERAGGSINAAVFLREFVGQTPWVHLDIAGPSQSPKERGYYGKGATGVGVRTLVELVRARS
jgi:leucyl aminopeptidase